MVTVTAKAISLSVRPTQSADLCFPVDGIIEYLPSGLLGQTFEGIDIKTISNGLKPNVELPVPGNLVELPPSDEINPEDPTIAGPLGDGPEQIEVALKGRALAKLRSADVATDLTQLLSWYGLKESTDESDEAVHARVNLLGSQPGQSNSLYKLIDRLSDELEKRYNRLDAAYDADPYPWGVFPKTIATTSGNTVGAAKSTTTGTPVSTTTQEQNLDTTSTTETITEGREFATPRSDNRARYLRAEIGLRQEQLAAYRLVKLNSADNIMYQKAMSATEVRRLQIALLNRYLVPPFEGTVTAIFRNVGDYVTVGQPVLRLENDAEVYLVGTIKCRGLIRVGYKVEVETTLFGEPGASSIIIYGVVRAIRGHEPIDEQWNVMIRCENVDSHGSRLLPLNYNFDFNTTTINLTSP